jgi:hypothetical protein
VVGPQVREIASAAVVNPSTEGHLLRAAQTSGLKGLKDEARRVKARAVSETEARARYEQIRKQRSLVMWIDDNGVGRLEARLTPDALGQVKSALQRETNAVFNEARRTGHRECTEAYAADALVALVTGTSAIGMSATRTRSNAKTPPPTTMMHLRVDAAALRRGRLEDGEVCEIPGVGPVPLATATAAIGNAVLKVIVSEGVDVLSVANMKRAIPAHLRRALENRDEKCVVPGCDVAQGLENDHYQIDFMSDGPTELWNLCRLCRWHHYMKTLSEKKLVLTS